jgi:hypothetical protein
MRIQGATAKALTAAKRTTRKRAGNSKKGRCKNCDEPFTKNREWQEFCNDACQKEFWRAGGVSIRRLMPFIKNMVEEAMRPHVEELRQLREEINAKLAKALNI